MNCWMQQGGHSAGTSVSISCVIYHFDSKWKNTEWRITFILDTKSTGSLIFDPPWETVFLRIETNFWKQTRGMIVEFQFINYLYTFLRKYNVYNVVLVIGLFGFENRFFSSNILNDFSQVYHFPSLPIPDFAERFPIPNEWNSKQQTAFVQQQQKNHSYSIRYQLPFPCSKLWSMA